MQQGSRERFGSGRRRPLVRALLAMLVVGALGLAWAALAFVRSVPRLFRRNAELKAQNYYMAEFEFKMVATQQYLNQGRYLEACRTLRRIAAEMRSGEGLVKMPEGADPAARMAFLLERQAPSTGAFMDPSYPLFTYFAPTCNVVETLAALARETGRPLRLKYPLRFLDQLRTPEQLRTYLDSLLYLDPLWARLPGPGPYGPGVSELVSFEVLEAAGVRPFSQPWIDELRRWLDATQDPVTGFWGPRIGKPGAWRQRTDINPTFHILKFVLDASGNNRSARFPLRHGDALARGILEQLAAPMPEDTARQHEWGIQQYQGARIIVRYLWPHLSEAQKTDARHRFRVMLGPIWRLYRPGDGGFAYYSSDRRADVDGTGLATALLEVLGTMPGTPERERLWGPAREAGLRPTRVAVPDWRGAAPPAVPGARSFRVYRDQLPAGRACEDPHLVQVFYPEGTQGLDGVELRQGLARFLGNGGPGFGNWSSKDQLRTLPLGLERPVRPVPVARGFDLVPIARRYPATRRFYVVAYDAVQVPILALEYHPGAR